MAKRGGHGEGEAGDRSPALPEHHRMRARTREGKNRAKGEDQRRRTRHASGTLTWKLPQRRLVVRLYLQNVRYHRRHTGRQRGRGTRRVRYTGGTQLGEGHMQHPGAGKQLQWAAVPCSCFCPQPDSCIIREEILQLQRAILPTPKQPSEHTGNKLFLSNTAVLFYT